MKPKNYKHNLCYFNIYRIIKSTKGISYLEFTIMFVVLIGAFYILFQCFAIINTQILIMNTCRSSLRAVEVYGKAPDFLKEEIKEALQKVPNVEQDTIKIYINDSENFGGVQYQMRNTITVKVSVVYNLYFIGNIETLNRVKYPIPLSSTYTGTSERLWKENEWDAISGAYIDDYKPVIE